MDAPPEDEEVPEPDEPDDALLPESLEPEPVDELRLPVLLELPLVVVELPPVVELELMVEFVVGKGARVVPLLTAVAVTFETAALREAELVATGRKRV
jgi:hypothetical protein